MDVSSCSSSTSMMDCSKVFITLASEDSNTPWAPSNKSYKAPPPPRSGHQHIQNGLDLPVKVKELSILVLSPCWKNALFFISPSSTCVCASIPVLSSKCHKPKTETSAAGTALPVVLAGTHPSGTPQLPSEEGNASNSFLTLSLSVSCFRRLLVGHKVNREIHGNPLVLRQGHIKDGLLLKTTCIAVLNRPWASASE